MLQSTVEGTSLARLPGALVVRPERGGGGAMDATSALEGRGL